MKLRSMEEKISYRLFLMGFLGLLFTAALCIFVFHKAFTAACCLNLLLISPWRTISPARRSVRP